MSILALNKVNYSYKNGKSVLSDVSMEFEKGKFYTILGVSGSGKSTLLSLLAGLDEPKSGAVLYNNEDIKIKGYEKHRKNNISLKYFKRKFGKPKTAETGQNLKASRCYDCVAGQVPFRFGIALFVFRICILPKAAAEK